MDIGYKSQYEKQVQGTPCYGTFAVVYKQNHENNSGIRSMRYRHF